MQLRSHADGQPVKRFKRKMGYVQSDMCTRYEILNVASAQQWDSLRRMIWWYCAFAHLRRRIACNQWHSQPKSVWGAKMFDFRRIAPFCLRYRLSKHKMTIFAEILVGNMTPCLRLCLKHSNACDRRQIRRTVSDERSRFLFSIRSTRCTRTR